MREEMEAVFQVVMVILVTWGIIGTPIYFVLTKRKKISIIACGPLVCTVYVQFKLLQWFYHMLGYDFWFDEHGILQGRRIN